MATWVNVSHPTPWHRSILKPVSSTVLSAQVRVTRLVLAVAVRLLGAPWSGVTAVDVLLNPESQAGVPLVALIR